MSSKKLSPSLVSKSKTKPKAYLHNRSARPVFQKILVKETLSTDKVKLVYQILLILIPTDGSVKNINDLVFK